MALNLDAFKEYKQEQTQSSSNTNNTNNSNNVNRENSNSDTRTTNSINSTGTDHSLFSKEEKNEKKETGVFGAYQEILDERYKDDENLSAKDAFSRLTNAGILNEHYYNRMICATEKLVKNTDWMISMADENGNISDVALADAVAASFDSELDLYIQDIVGEVMAKHGTCSKSYLSADARKELAAKGIRVDSVGQGDEETGKNTNRVYAFSLVELPPNFDQMSPDEQLAYVNSDEAKIVEDKAGNKGSYLFADALIPDGYAQNAEINMSSILDTMGYDCVSKADFIGSDGKFNEAEYRSMLSEVASMVNSGELSASDSINEIYGNTREISDSIKRLWGGDGSAPGQHGSSGSDSISKEFTEEAKAEEEKENDKYESILEDKKKDYKAEHGVDATGDDLAKLEREAKQEAQNQL